MAWCFEALPPSRTNQENQPRPSGDVASTCHTKTHTQRNLSRFKVVVFVCKGKTWLAAYTCNLRVILSYSEFKDNLGYRRPGRTRTTAPSAECLLFNMGTWARFSVHMSTCAFLAWPVRERKHSLLVYQVWCPDFTPQTPGWTPKSCPPTHTWLRSWPRQQGISLERQKTEGLPGACWPINIAEYYSSDLLSDHVSKYKGPAPREGSVNQWMNWSEHIEHPK